MQMMGEILFHLAFPVHDLEAARRFYVDGLGCTEGRTTRAAMILELAGHQLVAHFSREGCAPQKGIYPRHFGLIFKSEQDWQRLADRAREKALRFRQEPRRRFPGTRLEHLTFFLEDPSGNLLEFKHYRYDSAIFGEQGSSRIGDTDETVG